LRVGWSGLGLSVVDEKRGTRLLRKTQKEVGSCGEAKASYRFQREREGKS